MRPEYREQGPVGYKMRLQYWYVKNQIYCQYTLYT